MTLCGKKSYEGISPDRACHQDSSDASQKTDRSYSHLMVASRLPDQLSVLYSLFWKKAHQITPHLPISGAVIDRCFGVILERVLGWCDFDASLQDVRAIKGRVSGSVHSQGDQERTSKESQGSQHYEPGRSGDGVGALYQTDMELMSWYVHGWKVWDTKPVFCVSEYHKNTHISVLKMKQDKLWQPGTIIILMR